MGLVKRWYIISILCLALAGCTAEKPTVEQGSDCVGQPVLFSSGNMAEARTKSDPAPIGSTSPYYLGMTNTAGVPYMPVNGRFVCTMYYHAAAGDTDASVFDVKDIADGGTYTTAWLKVNNNLGNSVYWNKEFNDVGVDTDALGFDKAATCFYWQNRLTHAFLAQTDYNKLITNDGASVAQGKLKLYPNSDTQLTIGDVEISVNTYDLTRSDLMSSMSMQPDPLLALTIMKPAGATQEANRVRLYFRHQFSQIQVNLKGAADNSAELTSDQIESVELLGISEKGYVCDRLNADGTIGVAGETAFYEAVNLDGYTNEQLEENKWGTSFNMFDMATGDIEDGHDTGYATGFLKSFNAIAFGYLSAIRIFWHEGTPSEPGIRHITTFEVPQKQNVDDVDLRTLQSGMKYIYDLELRRGTLAVIRTQILEWMQDENLVYSSDGTITN